MSEHVKSREMLRCVQHDCPEKRKNMSGLLRHLKTHGFFFCYDCCESFDSNDSVDRHHASCQKHCIALHGRSDTLLTEHVVADRRHRREIGCPTWRKTDLAEIWWYLDHLYHFNGVALAMDELQHNHGLPVDSQPYEIFSVAGIDSRGEFPGTPAISTGSGQAEAMIVDLPLNELSQLTVRAPEVGAMSHHIGVMYGANAPSIEPSQPSYHYASSHSGPNGSTVPQELYHQMPLGQTQYVDSYAQGSTAGIDVTFDSISLEPYMIKPRSFWEPQPEPGESFLIQGYFNAVQSQWPGDVS